jgi:hypothetical protein
MAHLAPDWQLARDTALLSNIHPLAAQPKEQQKHA